jgi:hypothetical protein
MKAKQWRFSSYGHQSQSPNGGSVAVSGPHRCLSRNAGESHDRAEDFGGFGPRIAKSVEARPDGLLLHENFVFSLFPMHAGMRQYWRDMESLLKWTRSEPHRVWWKNFLKDSGGTGFWHETYMMQGGMEAIYDDVAEPVGFMRFAPVHPARGAMFGAAHRAAKQHDAEPVVSEKELYGE